MVEKWENEREREIIERDSERESLRETVAPEFSKYKIGEKDTKNIFYVLGL